MCCLPFSLLIKLRVNNYHLQFEGNVHFIYLNVHFKPGYYESSITENLLTCIKIFFEWLLLEIKLVNLMYVQGTYKNKSIGKI